MEDDIRLSKPKHNLIGLLREFGSELDKWRAARKQTDLSLTFEEEETKEPPEPSRWREFCRWRYMPDCVLPDSFWQLPDDIQEEYQRKFAAFEQAT